MQAYKLLKVGVLAGIVVGVLFIYVQPFYGMTPVTDRHAALYSELTNFGYATAITVAWVTHLCVAILHGIAIVFMLILSGGAMSYFTTLVGMAWFASLIAAPVNAVIVSLVSTGSLPLLLKLPPLNIQLDEKFALHLTLFIAIGAVVWLYRRELRSECQFEKDAGLFDQCPQESTC